MITRVTTADIVSRDTSMAIGWPRQRYQTLGTGDRWCREDSDVASAITLMQEKHIRHLVVGDTQQHLVGIVSLYALALRTGDETSAGTAIRWPG